MQRQNFENEEQEPRLRIRHARVPREPDYPLHTSIAYTMLSLNAVQGQELPLEPMQKPQ